MKYCQKHRNCYLYHKFGLDAVEIIHGIKAFDADFLAQVSCFLRERCFVDLHKGLPVRCQVFCVPVDNCWIEHDFNGDDLLSGCLIIPHHYHLLPSPYNFDPTSPSCQNTTVTCQRHWHHLKTPTTQHCWSNTTTWRNNVPWRIKKVMRSMQVGQGKAEEGQGNTGKEQAVRTRYTCHFLKYILYFFTNVCAFQHP